MNIVIIGQGAMGLLWYSHLQDLLLEDSPVNSNHGKNSTKLTLRPSQRPRQCSVNYQFTSIKGLTREKTLHYASNPEVASADIILLMVKSYQVKTALADIAALINPKAVIVLCHNGMGTLSELPTEILANHCILAMITTHGCLRKNTLHAVHTGVGHSDIGLVSSLKSKEANKALITRLLTTLEQALPAVVYHENIIEKQWLKLAINCVINPLTALYNIDNGEINQPQFSQTIAAILQEVVLIADQEEIKLNLEELMNTVQTVAKATGKNSSSMRCDVNNHQLTEIDYINGYIQRLGLQYNIATPENSRLWQQISALNADK